MESQDGLVGTRAIAMTGDSRFVYPLGVAMVSLAKHSDLPLHLDYALPRDWSGMISISQLGLIEALALSLGWTFKAVECPIEAANLPRTRHISSMTFLKPAYFDVAQHDQVVFIDGDLIAVNDWTELLNPIRHDQAIAASREENMRDFELRWNPDLPAGWYLNAGVLQARPLVWQKKYTLQWRSHLVAYPSRGFKYLEQDIINATLLGDAEEISPTLNSRPAYGHSLLNARIVHYAGWWKPWLTVPTEVRRLDPNMLKAYEMFQSAETDLLDQVELCIGGRGRSEWLLERKRVRGQANWRAHHRYHRWAMAQKFHSIKGRASSAGGQTNG